MSHTIFEKQGFRFFFFDREETRFHVHVTCDHGEAKFWLEPVITVDSQIGLSDQELDDIKRLIKEGNGEIRTAWRDTNGDSTGVEAPHVSTLHARVTHISAFGVWLLIEDRELLLSHDDFPAFRDADEAAVRHVTRPDLRQLHWPDLDITLALGSLSRPSLEAELA